MPEIQKLIRLANERNVREKFTLARFKVRRDLLDRFRRRTAEDGLSGNVAIEAFINGYINSHPAVLAMVDQWMRDHAATPRPSKAQKMGRADLDEIYAAASGAMTNSEEED